MKSQQCVGRERAEGVGGMRDWRDPCVFPHIHEDLPARGAEAKQVLHHGLELGGQQLVSLRCEGRRQGTGELHHNPGKHR
jgi:hypothetical protein